METSTDGNFIYQYQVVLVGIIGFVGVALTLIFNAWLTRKEHKDTVNHDRATLRTALTAELKEIKKEVRVKIRDIEGQKGRLLVSTNPITDVYDNSIRNLGLLYNEELQHVMAAYICIKKMWLTFRLLADPSKYDEKGPFITLNSSYFKPMKEVYIDVVRKIDKAIQSLDC